MNRRGYALLALGMAAFTVYGSLVPFERRPPDEIELAIGRVRQAGLTIDSRSDFLANILLGVPLGFALLAAVRGERGGRGTLLAALALWPGCVLFAAAVEASQLGFRQRDCSLADVLAQGLGAAMGLAAWMVAGVRVNDGLRRLGSDPRAGGTIGRVLGAYLLVVLFIQLLPMDFITKPGRIYGKIVDREVTLVPFRDLIRADNGVTPAPWGLIRGWVELFGLYLPAGLLLSRLPGRTWQSSVGFLAAAGFGLGVGLAFEAAQLTVSRHPSTADAIAGAAGVVAGWLVGRLTRRGLSLEGALIAGQLWLAVLAAAHWMPFDFHEGRLANRLRAVNWLPLADLGSQNYLGALDAAVTRATLFIPVGVLVMAAGRNPIGRGRIAAAVGLALLLGGILETGQVFLPDRYPSTTDIFLAVFGAGVGATVTGRLRQKGTEAG